MGMRDHIRKLYTKYHTIEPFELADAMGIKVHYMDLGNMCGFYYYEKRIKQIFLNCNLPRHIQRFVLAHELGHAVLHTKSNTIFLNSTFISVDKLEIEANKFAVLLTLPDIELVVAEGYSISQMASMYGLPEEMIRLRLQQTNNM